MFQTYPRYGARDFERRWQTRLNTPLRRTTNNTFPLHVEDNASLPGTKPVQLGTPARDGPSGGRVARSIHFLGRSKSGRQTCFDPALATPLRVSAGERRALKAPLGSRAKTLIKLKRSPQSSSQAGCFPLGCQCRADVSLVGEAWRPSILVPALASQSGRGGRTIRGSRRTARRRVCRAAGRHQRAWRRLDRRVPRTCRRVFEAAGGGRTERQSHHQGPRVLQPRRHRGVSAALACAGPFTRTEKANIPWARLPCSEPASGSR